MCVCVCVCVCEREREREIGKIYGLSKRDLGACKGTSLLGSSVESPFIFLYKKIRKNKYKLHVKNTSNVID